MKRLIVSLLLAHVTLLAADPSSPRIERLKASPQTAAEFWQEIRAKHAPLIEELPGDKANVLVTFLWQGPASLEQPIVFANVFAENNADRQRLTYIPGTDVWYRTYQFARDLPILYELSPAGEASLQRDPLNPRFIEGSMGGSMAILPGVRNLEYSSASPPPRGRMDGTVVRSIATGKVQQLRTWVPAGFDPTRNTYDVLVVLDPQIYTGPVPLTNILDHLHDTKAIRPTIAIFVDNADRGVELACSPEFSSYLVDRVLRAAEAKYKWKPDRARTTILGSSLGGLAAACAAIHKPEHFGNIVALSGSFRWSPQGDQQPEWFARRLATLSSVPAPVNFHIGVGTTETGTPKEPGSPSLLTASRHLRDILQTKGYNVSYREFPGAHDPLSWASVLPDMLKSALSPAPARRP